MKSWIRKTCLYRIAAMLLVVSCLFLPDAAGTETYSYNFDGSPYVWDISGSYSGTLYDLDTNYTITQDAAGKITGDGDVSGTLYIEKYDIDVDIDMTCTITGSVTQKNGICTVKLTIKATGTADYDGDTYKATATETITAQIDPDSNEISGTAKARVSAAGRSVSGSEDFAVSLPDDMNGTATLTIDYSGDKTLSGDATLLISNGDSYNFTAKGSYNAKKNEYTLTLKGDAEAPKNSLVLKVDATSGVIKSMTGKVLGQQLKVTDITPTP